MLSCTYPISFATGVEFDLLYVSQGIYFPGCPQGEGKKKIEKLSKESCEKNSKMKEKFLHSSWKSFAVDQNRQNSWYAELLMFGI